VGIAPLGILADQLDDAHAPVLLGFRDAAHAAGAELLSAPHVATDDGSLGYHGLVTELLARQLDRDDHAEVFACGPPAMLEAVRALCAATSPPTLAQLALESGMACGYGACFGCVVPTRGGYLRLCVDGPVLDAADVEHVG
jgi:NAD(P)H-flavin reductase